MSIISKELLSEVLNENRVTIKNLCISNNILIYVSFCSPNELNGTNYNEHLLNDYHCLKADIYQEINIYELAHKCKEWAWDSHEYKLYSTIGFCKFFWSYTDSIGIMRAHERSFDADSEPEAIFKACQWILDNKDK